MANKINEQTSGVYIISATPFRDNGDIDFESADRLTDFYIEKNVSGITILGMMGEANKLSVSESIKFMRRVIKRVNGQVPVVVGISNTGMDNLASLSYEAMDLGGAGVMISPFAAQKTDTAIYNYFSAVADKLGDDIPLVYQDFPLATNANVSVDCLMRIVRDIPQVVMLKHEEWPGLGKLSALRENSEKEGLRRISILCGNGGLYLPQEFARGADGAMTGFAFPEMLVQFCHKQAAGDIDGAENLFEVYLPMIRHEQQPGYGLAVRKEILRRRGAIVCAKTRDPGPSLTKADHKDLDRLLLRLERRLAEFNA
ncbi:MAG: dihydrodipicolinate synthase family protein [Sphingomonadales bacterium]|jgi:4-hydroxy-tetrahydrodipicolinate synthase